MRLDPLILLTVPLALLGAWASTKFEGSWPVKALYGFDAGAVAVLWLWVVSRHQMGLIEASVTWAVLYEGAYTLGFVLLGSRCGWLAWVGVALGLVSVVLMTLGGEEAG
ncbi:MAG: hypothetical protein A2Y38_10420 [Spirochaetes bacterium GWB1_59_5]|nr:MAG: hypothetical protein A2Y38_10420 [Spirochaetes bacterium GWB1_59_5]